MLAARTLHRWLVVQAVLWLGILAYCGLAIARSGLGRRDLATLGAAVLASWLVLWILLGTGGRRADWITFARFAGLLAAGVWAVAGGVSWWVWGSLVAVVGCDLLDGWVARRWGGSEAGAILDMETDQLVTLVLSLLACHLAAAPLWLLALPGLRYAYILYVALLGMPAQDPKPRDGDNTRGKRICAATLAMLLVCLAPSSPGWLRLGASIVALAGLLYSFGSDAVFLARRRLGLRAAR